eukprot:84624-Prymnesium_polylepis.1
MCIRDRAVVATLAARERPREKAETVRASRRGRGGGPLHGAGAVDVRAGVHLDRHSDRAPLPSQGAPASP